MASSRLSISIVLFLGMMLLDSSTSSPISTDPLITIKSQLERDYDNIIYMLLASETANYCQGEEHSPFSITIGDKTMTNTKRGFEELNIFPVFKSVCHSFVPSIYHQAEKMKYSAAARTTIQLLNKYYRKKRGEDEKCEQLLALDELWRMYFMFPMDRCH